MEQGRCRSSGRLFYERASSFFGNRLIALPQFGMGIEGKRIVDFENQAIDSELG